MQVTNYAIKNLLKACLITELVVFGSVTSSKAGSVEREEASKMELIDVGQIVEVQRLQAERQFYEKVSNTLCKEKGSEQMFPDVCGVAKDMLRGMNNGVRPTVQRIVNKGAEDGAQVAALPALNGAKPLDDNLPSGLPGSLRNGSSPDGGVKRAIATYALVGVYGDEDDLQVEIRSSSGRHYLMGMHSRVGKFRIVDVYPEGIDVQLLSNEKAERVFVAVGSQI
jgi:hypothetical protein